MNDYTTPLVSVVIPSYNHARYLGRALQSLLDQTFVNWEAIIVDNHSTDHTDEVISGFSDPRIAYFKIHNNGVIAASRNAGIRAAKGEWIAFLDSDDWWRSDKLEVCFAAINETVDLVYHDLEIVREPPARLYRRHVKSRKITKPVLKDLLLRGNPIATSSVVVRACLINQIGGMDESVDMIAAEDYNAWMRIAKITDGFLYLSRNLGFYLFHAGGGSRKSIDILFHNACKEFIYLLNPKEQLIYNATAKYFIALNDFNSGMVSKANKNLLFSIQYGELYIKIKSVLLYIIMSLKTFKQAVL